MNQLVLSVQEFNTLLGSLSELSWKQADPIINFLRTIANKQIEEQRNAAEIAPAE